MPTIINILAPAINDHAENRIGEVSDRENDDLAGKVEGCLEGIRLFREAQTELQRHLLDLSERQEVIFEQVRDHDHNGFGEICSELAECYRKAQDAVAEHNVAMRSISGDMIDVASATLENDDRMTAIADVCKQRQNRNSADILNCAKGYGKTWEMLVTLKDDFEKLETICENWDDEVAKLKGTMTRLSRRVQNIEDYEDVDEAEEEEKRKDAREVQSTKHTQTRRGTRSASVCRRRRHARSLRKYQIEEHRRGTASDETNWPVKPINKKRLGIFFIAQLCNTTFLLRQLICDGSTYSLVGIFCMIVLSFSIMFEKHAYLETMKSHSLDLHGLFSHAGVLYLGSIPSTYKRAGKLPVSARHPVVSSVPDL